jgi:hypothetical protein
MYIVAPASFRSNKAVDFGCEETRSNFLSRYVQERPPASLPCCPLRPFRLLRFSSVTAIWQLESPAPEVEDACLQLNHAGLPRMTLSNQAHITSFLRQQSSTIPALAVPT